MKKNILLGITGSISAYKACDIANILTKKGYNVDVLITKSGAKLVSPFTLQTLTKNKVYSEMFEAYVPEVEHISLAQKADLFLVAPATANIIGKIANGIADDMLTTTIMATKAPKFIAPAMNTNMYENPIVQDNLERLKRYGYHILEPIEGHLACGTTGKGALAKVDFIVNAVEEFLNK